MTNKTKSDSVSGLGSLERPHYAAGQLLEADDLNAAVDYTRDLVRIILRSLIGCGVICGFDITAEKGNDMSLTIAIGPGLALDAAGNLIEIRKSESIRFECTEAGMQFWLTVCYNQKACSPREAACGDDDSASMVHARIHEGFVIEASTKKPDGACMIEPPSKDIREHYLAKLKNNACAKECICDETPGCGDRCPCNCVVLGVVTVGNTTADTKTDLANRCNVQIMPRRLYTALLN
jgi:hypothetical protein